MSNKIIQITEENLRKAVVTGDLTQLAPEVFEKKKRVKKMQILISRWDVEQNEYIRNVYPVAVEEDFDWKELLNKPPMLMTLEWEE